LRVYPRSSRQAARALVGSIPVCSTAPLSQAASSPFCCCGVCLFAGYANCADHAWNTAAAVNAGVHGIRNTD
jgi:hypothetical protein